MKWGQFIKENTLLKWRSCYISYDVLKQIIKTISTPNTTQTTASAKLKLKFATTLETDLLKVESFYNYQRRILTKQYDILMLHWNNKPQNHIIYSIINALNQLLIQLTELQHYAFINAEGFRKSVKKYDKRLSSNIGQNYYPSFHKYNFYTQHSIKRIIHTISNITNDNTQTDEQINDIQDCEDIQHLLQSAQSDKIWQLFIHSIRANKYDIFESITQHLNTNVSDENTLKTIINHSDLLGNTALMTCCATSGSIKIAQLLIEYGADIHMVNHYYRTALHIAAQRGRKNIITLLLNTMKEKKETQLIHQLDKDMHNALHLGCLRKQYICCALLIEFDSSIVNQQNADGITPLMIICDVHNEEEGNGTNDLSVLMHVLLKYCNNINQRDLKLQSVVHYVCNSGNKVCMDILLRHNINPFVFDCDGQSALHIAAQHGYFAILKKLCEYAKDMNNDCIWDKYIPIYDHTDDKGRTALHICASKAYNKCAEYLLSIGADANIMDYNGCNAHSFAAYMGNLDRHIQRLEEKEDYAYEEKRKHMMYRPKRKGSGSRSRVEAMNDVSYMDVDKPSVDLMPPSSSLIGSSGCIVKFRIQCHITNKQHLYIIGDCEELGKWNVTKGVKMYKNKMPTFMSGDEDESDNNNELRTFEEHRDSLASSLDTEITTWIAEILLPKNIAIKYKYIIRTHSSLESYESLPTDRQATIHESMIIDDGVYGVVIGTKTRSIPRHKSEGYALSQLNENANANNFEDDIHITVSNDSYDMLPKETSYVQSGWLVCDAQLQIRLGHTVNAQKRSPLIVNNNIHIDRVVIRSGYINKNRYRGIHINIKHKDISGRKVYKFQSNSKQINALCSLEFEFFPRYGAAIARAFVLPSVILKKNVDALTLPLSSCNGLGPLIGEFNFEYMLITPFKHEYCGNVLCKTFKHQSAYNKAIVIGHRGTGSHGSADLPGPRRTHIKENTILAFNTAESFGADCVEFDVQLTKDEIPIIYHDFLFPIGPFKIPINKITFEELRTYNKQIIEKRSIGDDERAHTPEAHVTNIMNMKEFNNLLDDHFCSLEDVFKLAPMRLGFNIEFKYPLYDECIADGVESTVDVNEYVDKILNIVFNYDSPNRYIIFSSFHPDICIALALKQPQFPVLFLTQAGKTDTCDARCYSLKNAILFAKVHSLFGIVADAKAIIESPQLIDVVHKHGLILLTYGTQNNDKDIIDLQMEHGIDGLISDHVQYVRQHLDSKTTKSVDCE